MIYLKYNKFDGTISKNTTRSLLMRKKMGEIGSGGREIVKVRKHKPNYIRLSKIKKWGEWSS